MLPLSLIANFAKWLAGLFIALVLCEPAFGQLGKSPEEFSVWKEERNELLEGLKSAPRDEAIPELFIQLTKLNNQSKAPETEDLLNLALEVLVSFRGYETFYKDKIVQAKINYKQAGIVDFEEYGNAQGGISRLQYIRRPEVVAVLGYLLNDLEGRDGKVLGGGPVHGGDFSWTVNCLAAVQTIHALRIENPPTPPMRAETQWEQVDAWKDWWNEIAAGKRTYRFIGSPIEYGPNGPVEKKVMGDRSHNRTERNAAITPQTESEETTVGSNTAGKIAGSFAAVLALAGAWFALRKRVR